MVPEEDVIRLQQWAEQAVPEHVRDQLRVELDVEDRSVTVLECRPPWDPAQMGRAWIRVPIGRLRYVKSRKEWQLYYSDSNDRFHRYEGLATSSNIGDLIQEIDRDPYAIFWG